MANPEIATAKRCLTCGYDLRGLPEPRCPECGRGFDLTDDRTFSSEAPAGRMLLSLSVIGLTLFLTPLWLILAALLLRITRGAAGEFPIELGAAFCPLVGLVVGFGTSCFAMMRALVLIRRRDVIQTDRARVVTAAAIGAIPVGMTSLACVLYVIVTVLRVALQ